MVKKLLIIFFLSSCASGFIVKSDADISFKPNKYNSFVLVPPSPFDLSEGLEDNPIRNNRISYALKEQLKELGFQEKADSKLKVSFAIKEKEKRGSFFPRIGYGLRNDAFSFRISPFNNVPINFLSIKFFDQELEKVVWYARLRVNINSLDQQESTNQIVQKVIEKYVSES